MPRYLLALITVVGLFIQTTFANSLQVVPSINNEAILLALNLKNI